MEIKSESEYQVALKRLDVVFMADQSTPEGEDLQVLADAIEAYENIHHPIGPPAVPTMELLSAEPDNAESAGNNVPLIESIVSRAGNTLKLRFLDGSVGEIDMLEAFGFAMESPKVIDDRIEWVAVGEGWRVPTYTNSRRLWLNTKFL